jgi:hypothetical protein
MRKGVAQNVNNGFARCAKLGVFDSTESRLSAFGALDWLKRVSDLGGAGD